MTVFKGVLLFDIAEPAIGRWRNLLGYRGYIEVWQLEGTKQQVVIEPYFDEENQELDYDGEWHVLSQDEETGLSGTIGFYATEEQANKAAKKYMRQNPKGV
jgi:hypothetical protein